MEVYQKASQYDNYGGGQMVMEVYKRARIDTRPLPLCQRRRLTIREGQADPVLLALHDPRRISNNSFLGARQKQMLSLRDAPGQLRLGDAPHQQQLTDRGSQFQLTDRNLDSDRHPVKEDDRDFDFRTPSMKVVTPRWDQLMQNLSKLTNDAHGREFAEFLRNDCFKPNLLWTNANGDHLSFEMPFAMKMEQLIDAAWERRRLALSRLRPGCNQTHLDASYEIPGDDMKEVWQLRLLSDVF